MILGIVIQVFVFWNSLAEATPVSYRVQTNEAQVVEDKNTAINNIDNNLTEYCEWQSLDKNLYKIEQADKSALWFATLFDEEFENPFRLKDHIEKYRLAKSRNSLEDARSTFYSHANLRPDLTLLDYSQLGSQHLQYVYNVKWQIRLGLKDRNNFLYFESLLEQLKSRNGKNHDDTDLHTKEFFHEDSRFGRMNLSGKELEVFGLCSFISPLNGIRCKNAIFNNKDLFSPKFYTEDIESNDGQITSAITAVPVFKEVLYGSYYTRVLRKSAIDILELIVNDSYSENSNVFDILFDNFKSSELSAFEAKTRAINVMTALSTGGGNFHSRLMDLDPLRKFYDKHYCIEGCNLNSIYLTSIVNSIVFLDYLKKKKFGNTFSFPKEIRYECNKGDWYHFWMAAGLTRSLSIRGYNKKISKLSTFAMSTGYHLHGGFLLTKQKFGTFINSASQDLLLASFGIRFGQDEISEAGVDYKAALKNYLAQMSTTLPLSSEEVVSLSAPSIGIKNAQLLGIRYLFHSVVNH